MLCENCHTNQAEMKVTLKDHNGIHEKWVCTSCASNENNWSPGQDDIEGAFVIKQILQHLASKHGLNFNDVAFQEEKRCPTCRMSLKDIADVGKFGCSDCYYTFKDDIVDIVQRVQGGQIAHVGKAPKSSFKKRTLRKQIEEKQSHLDVLVQAQKFEEAALVRDEINALKLQIEGGVREDGQ